MTLTPATSRSGSFSLAAEGEAALTGAVTLSEGSGVTLAQVGQDIEIAAAGGGLAVLFDETLAGEAAAIDTGADGIAAGSSVLALWMILRTTEAVVQSSALLRFNADSGNSYDRQSCGTSNTTVSGALTLAGSSFLLDAFGASAQAGAATILRATCVGYDQTTFHKSLEATQTQVEDTAADARLRTLALRWRNTAAITRVSIAAGSGNLVAGSRLLALGL